MKKYTFIILAAIFLVGCQTSSGSKIKNTQTSIPLAVSEDACVVGQVEQCYALGNAYYSKKEFSKAVSAYDSICQKQYVPACLKMAGMFESGQGLPVNLENALDIYTKACYLGYDKNCNDMKRLQKRLGITVKNWFFKGKLMMIKFTFLN